MEVGRERGRLEGRGSIHGNDDVIAINTVSPKKLDHISEASETVVFHGNNAQDYYIST